MPLLGFALDGINGRILVSNKIQDANTFDNPMGIEPVAFKDFKKAERNSIVFKMPAAAVVVLEIKAN